MKYLSIIIFVSMMIFTGACGESRKKIDDTAANVIIRSENKALMLKLKSDLQTVNRAVEHFHAMHGRYPSTLNELTQKGAITRIPKEPFGGEWNYDPNTGKVTSGSHPEFGNMTGWDGEL